MTSLKRCKEKHEKRYKKYRAIVWIPTIQWVMSVVPCNSCQVMHSIVVDCTRQKQTKCKTWEQQKAALKSLKLWTSSFWLTQMPGRFSLFPMITISSGCYQAGTSGEFSSRIIVDTAMLTPGSNHNCTNVEAVEASCCKKQPAAAHSRWQSKPILKAKQNKNGAM